MRSSEALFLDRARRPWLGRIGLVVRGFLFLLGACLTAYFTYAHERFIASGFQLGGALLVALAAVGAAWRVREHEAPASASVPHPLMVGLMSFAAASAFMAARRLVGGWSVVSVYLLLYLAVIAGVRVWSAGTGWTDRHVLALAAARS